MQTVDRAEVCVIGIDPASGKGLEFFNGSRYSSEREVPPEKSRLWMEEELEVGGPLLLTWDAPISFNPDDSLTTRPIERKKSPVSAWIQENVGNGRIADKAVFIGGFSGLSHWVISCQCLGMPYGNPPNGLRVACCPGDVLNHRDSSKWIVEVHPAVSMAVWWVALGIDGAFPKYKGCRKQQMEGARELIWDSFVQVGIVDDKNTHAPSNDDQLDAWVAWKMGVDFLDEKARWVGTPESGGFVLPSVAETKFELASKMHSYISKNY